MKQGLDDVVVARTVMSHIDGAAGNLVIRGKSLAELVALDDLGQVADVLWQGWHRFDAELYARACQELEERLQPWCGQLASMPASAAVTLGLSLVPEAEVPEAVMAAFPVSLGVWLRERRGLAALPTGEPLLESEPAARLAASLGWGDKARVSGLRGYWTTVCEHGMNASTFTARVVASTGATLLDAVQAAFNALKGPLHGGAPGPVLDLLDSLQGSTDLQAALLQRLRSGERLMGFGHRVYRAVDPRAQVLRAAAAALDSPRLRFAREVEQAALAALSVHKPDRPLRTNVEFYTALLLEALGFERETFTSLFACGRVLGWLGHCFEQRVTGRLIRPKAEYVEAATF